MTHSPSIGGPRRASGREPALPVWRSVPHALELLRDESTRPQALTALARLGEAAMPPLLDLLHDDDADVRRAAAFTLGRVLDSRWARKLVRSAHWTYHACQESGAVSRLLDALVRGSRPTRVACAVALGRLGDPRALPELLELLADQHRLPRLAAIWALGRIGLDEALPYLGDALEDDDALIASAAREAIDTIEMGILLEDLRQSIRHLAGTLDEQGAARARFEADGAALRAGLLALLQSSDPADILLRWDVGCALWLSDDHAAAIPALIDLLSVPDLCWVAADYVDYLGGAADRRILPALSQSDPDGQMAVAYLLQGGGEWAIPAIATRLPGAPSGVRLALVKALARIGHPAGLPTLHKLLGDPVPGVRTAAGWAIRQIESGDPPAGDRYAQPPLAALLAQLSDPDPDRRVGAASALGQYAATEADLSGIEAAAPALADLLADPVREVRMAAAYALGALGDPAGAPGLLALLGESDDTGLRLVAIKALGKIGDPSAVDPLASLQSKADTRCIVVAVEKALARIGSADVSK